MCVCVGFDSSKEKQRLQNIMSFGSEAEGPKVASSLPAQNDEPDVDRFDEGLWTLWWYPKLKRELVYLHTCICSSFPDI